MTDTRFRVVENGIQGTSRRNLAQRLVSGVAWAFSAKVVGLSSGLIVNALLARMLSQDEMGAYFLTVSVTMCAAIVASFGLKQTVVRLISDSMARGLPGRARAALSVVFVIAAVGALLVCGSYYFFLGEWLFRSVFQIPMLGTATGLIAVWISVLAFQTPVAETFRGLHEIRVAVFLDGILASALLAVTLAAFFLTGVPVDFMLAVLVSTLATGASLGLGTALFLRRRNRFQGDGSIRPGEVVSISAPLFVTNLSSYAMNQFSLWIVAAFLVTADVAIYGAAWRLVNLLALPLLLMNMSVDPVIAELHATKDNRSLQNALRGTATLAGAPALIVLLAYAFFGADILALVFGAPYRDAAWILLILSVGMLGNVLTGSCGQVLALTGHQRELMTITLASGIGTVILALISVRLWGLTGVASAVAAGRILQNVVAWLLVYRLTGLWTHGTLNPTFVLTAVKRVLGRSG